MRTFIAVGSFLIFCTFAAYGIDDRKLVDMTYPFSHETLHWPTAKSFELETVNEGRTPQGYWYSSYNYSASEHMGTHLDAPFHFAEGKWTTEQIPLARDLRFLLLELFCLLLKDFRVARGQKKSASKEKNRDETRRQPCSFHKPFLLRSALASSKAR